MNDDMNMLEFGLDDAKVIKPQGIDRFKQEKSNHTDRVSIILFKTFADVVISAKTRERGEQLSDDEKAGFIKKIDEKLAENLSKKIEDLTEIDRLDVKQPRFAVAYTHYKDGLGSVRCLGQWQGGMLTKPGLCCKEIGDADQTVATIILRYPIDEQKQVDADLLKKRRYTYIEVWRMSAKKFKQIEGVYIDARSNDMQVIDMKVTLDGDTRYQKQRIENGMSAFWARENTDAEIRSWVLDQGLRAQKYIKRDLGFQMNAEKLAERLGGEAAASRSLSGEAAASVPKFQSSYDDLLT
ncbi:MAG TPA: hypothetical protein ENI61_07040 [Ignavibacteria bacterium]|nr:hypothetical protein [Ignavibacteria bacterium]